MHEAFFNYSATQYLFYDPTKLAIRFILRKEVDFLSSQGDNFNKTVSFDDTLHFVDDQNVLTYVDSECCLTFYRQKSDKFNGKKANADLVKNSSASQNYSEKEQFFKKHTSNNFVDPYNV